MDNPLWSWLHEELAPLGSVSIKRMFGGAGVRIDGLMMGLIADDVLYLKADAGNAARFDAEGLGPFIYVKDGRPMAMSYRQLPEAAYDDGLLLREWAQLAVAAAHRAQMNRKPKRR